MAYRFIGKERLAVIKLNAKRLLLNAKTDCNGCYVFSISIRRDQLPAYRICVVLPGYC
jgi:hypothetical protein